MIMAIVNVSKLSNNFDMNLKCLNWPNKKNTLYYTYMVCMEDYLGMKDTQQNTKWL